MHPSRSSVVDLIFTKCSLVYGRDFLSRWEGIDLDAVKADWVHELGGLLDKPQAIRHALMHLPARAPNVVEFAKLCISMQDAYTALPPPKANEEIVAHVKERLAEIRRGLNKPEIA
jgi:hypothetical protein